MSNKTTAHVPSTGRVTRDEIRAAINADKRRETRVKNDIFGPEKPDFKNPSFKNTFSFLEKMGVFKVESDRIEPLVRINKKSFEKWVPRRKPIDGKLVVACQLYEGPNVDLEKLDNAGIAKQVDIFTTKSKWQYKAIHDLRYGHRPFVVEKEPEYFHGALYVIRDLWTDMCLV